MNSVNVNRKIRDCVEVVELRKSKAVVDYQNPTELKRLIVRIFRQNRTDEVPKANVWL